MKVCYGIIKLIPVRFCHSKHHNTVNNLSLALIIDSSRVYVELLPSFALLFDVQCTLYTVHTS